jgi:hypothetical protein
MFELRLGDDVDDFCAKCKRVTNHSIVAMMAADPAKVRCRTCYHEHPFMKCEPPPKKESKSKAKAVAEPEAKAPEPASPTSD